MSDSTSRHLERYPEDDAYGALPPAEQQVENPLLMVHRRLRGRYPLAIALAILFAIPGAYVGWNLKKPKYLSTGIIRVAPTLQPILYHESPENEVPPMFDAFVEAQRSYVRTRRVMDRAVDHEDMRSVNWPTGRKGVRELEEAISVRRGRGEQLIYVEAAHVDPVMAKTAVNALLDAYLEIYGEINNTSTIYTIRRLQDRERDLEQRLDSLRRAVQELSEQYGPTMLREIHTSRVGELGEVQRLVAQLEEAINEQRAALEGRPGGPLDREALTERLIAQDEDLADLAQREEQIEARIEAMSGKYGPNHRAIKSMKDELSLVRIQVRNRVDELADQVQQLPPDASLPLREQYTLDQLEIRLVREQRRLESLEEEASRLGAKLAQIETLQSEIRLNEQKLNDTKIRIDQIRVENPQGSTERVTIPQRGELPVEPRDRRPVLAAAGGMGGFFAGFGLVFLLGLLDSSYRYIDDIERDTLGAPLLGTLPDLGARSPEHDELAALSVHHLRNMLHLNLAKSNGDARVFTITSAAAGDGKTSLALALAMSYAVSGRSTLLVDADLVGRGVTRELDMRRQPGLREAMRSADLSEQIHDTSVERLSVMPVGQGEEFDARHLSHESVHLLLRDLRSRYDAIIIDTGPLLGSLEANLACSNSDGVILTVSRGQSHRLVEACIERLSRMGAPCAGLVFNRASVEDFENSVSATSLFSQSVRMPPSDDAELEHDGRPVRVAGGALGRAVVGGGESEEEPQRVAS